MSSVLIDSIRQLKPAGQEGFEGLVASLLSTLTGRSFHLAKSGDSRFWFWQQAVLGEVADGPQLEKRLRFVEINLDTITKIARKNEKKMTEYLFGQKTKPGEVWPWMQFS